MKMTQVITVPFDIPPAKHCESLPLRNQVGIDLNVSVLLVNFHRNEKCYGDFCRESNQQFCQK